MLERERKKERRVQVVRGRSLCGVMPEYKQLLLRLHCMEAGHERAQACTSQSATSQNDAALSPAKTRWTGQALLLPAFSLQHSRRDPLARTTALVGCAHFKNSCPLQNIVQKGQEPSCQRGFAAALL